MEYSFFLIDFYINFYQKAKENKFGKQEKKSGKAFLIILIILFLLIIAAVGYYLCIRQKRKSEIIKIT